MKGILEFDLEDEGVEFKAAVEGLDWKIVVQEMDTFLRNSIKHGDPKADPGYRVEDALQQVRDHLNKLVYDRCLVLWE